VPYMSAEDIAGKKVIVFANLKVRFARADDDDLRGVSLSPPPTCFLREMTDKRYSRCAHPFVSNRRVNSRAFRRTA